MAISRVQRELNRRRAKKSKKYVAKTKSELTCTNCHLKLMTCKPGQRYCDHPDCQAARKKQNINDYYVRKAKEILEKQNADFN